MAPDTPPVLEIKDLSFGFPGTDGRPLGSTPFIQDFSLTLHTGDRCLLVGANGAGKTTILRIIGGQHMVSPDMVRVLGRSAFHDTSLVPSGDLCYLGGEWRRDVAFAGFDVPLQMDISARKMIFGVQDISPERRDRLIKVLDIDLNWRLHTVSDGQRRRVQICMGLLRPFKVLLLDEVTVDLDVLARADLLSFLLSESQDHRATIVYATHIFDGLEKWPTHIAYVSQGRLQFAKPLLEIEELKQLSLMRTVEKWLRKEIELERKKRASGMATPELVKDSVKLLNNGWEAGRLHSTLAGEGPYNLSSNHVLRM